MKRWVKILILMLATFGLVFGGSYYGLRQLKEWGVEFAASSKPFDMVIKNGQLLDGTGKAPYKADVGIKNGKIAFIGVIEPPDGVPVIDAEGMFVAPGFIDLFSRLNGSLDGPQPLEAMARQGVTTILAGNGGNSPEDLEQHIRQVSMDGLPVNYGVMAGYDTLYQLAEGLAALQPKEKAKAQADGAKRPDIGHIEQYLRYNMELGAFGLSVDFNSPQARQMTREELEALTKVVGERSGILAFHLPEDPRDGQGQMTGAVDLARNSQSKLLVAPWRYLGNLPEDARNSLVSPLSGYKNAYLGFFPEAVQGSALRQTLQRAYSKFPPEDIELVEVEGAGGKQLIGKTLAQAAAERGMDPKAFARSLMAGGQVLVQVRSAKPVNLAWLAPFPFVLVASDGGEGKATDFSPMAYPAFLKQYVHLQNLLSWEEAVFRLSSEPARLLGLSDRGRIEKDYWADLVLIHPAALEKDNPLEGIPYVFINGVPVVMDGKMQTAHGQEGAGQAGETAQKTKGRPGVFLQGRLPLAGEPKK